MTWKKKTTIKSVKHVIEEETERVVGMQNQAMLTRPRKIKANSLWKVGCMALNYYSHQIHWKSNRIKGDPHQKNANRNEKFFI